MISSEERSNAHCHGWRNIVMDGFGQGGKRTLIEYLRGLARNFDMEK
jgi:hypothetical protein